MTTEGHEADATGKDAFEMTDEEYQKAKGELFSSDADKTEADTAGAEDGNTSPDSQRLEADGDKGQGKEPDKQQAEEKDKPFSLDEPKQPEAKEDGTEKQEPEYHEIVHRGQVHRVTKEKLLELAQKGFDYDVKVGPHSKLVQIVDADRGAQDALNSYLRSKYGQPEKQVEESVASKLKPMAEYEDERQWLEDNVKLLAPKVIPQPQRAPAPNPVELLNNAIRSYDPVSSQDVLPVLASEAQRLSVADSRRIEEAAAKGDFKPFFKFYDYVKSKHAAPVAPPQPQPKPQFRMKTGGGEPPRAADKNINAWDMPAKDFQAYLAKVKSGYS